MHKTAAVCFLSGATTSLAPHLLRMLPPLVFSLVCLLPTCLCSVSLAATSLIDYQDGSGTAVSDSSIVLCCSRFSSHIMQSSALISTRCCATRGTTTFVLAPNRCANRSQWHCCCPLVSAHPCFVLTELARQERCTSVTKTLLTFRISQLAGEQGAGAYPAWSPTETVYRIPGAKRWAPSQPSPKHDDHHARLDAELLFLGAYRARGHVVFFGSAVGELTELATLHGVSVIIVPLERAVLPWQWQCCASSCLVAAAPGPS